MKRYFCLIVLLVTVICALTSCNESAVDLSQVYDVPYEPAVANKKTIELYGKEYQLEYMASSFLRFEGRYYHIYRVVGMEGAKVCLFGYGDIRSILIPGQTTVDINSNMTDEEIRIALEQAVGEIVDFSSYEFFERLNENFVYWYNAVDGIMAEHVLISYDMSKGVVNTVAFNNSHLDAQSLQFDLDEDKLNQLLNAKLGISDSNSSRQYELEEKPLFCTCHGELYVKYKLKKVGHDTSSEFMFPAKMIDKTAK